MLPQGSVTSGPLRPRLRADDNSQVGLQEHPYFGLLLVFYMGRADTFSCLPKSNVTRHGCQRSDPMHRHGGIAGWWPSVMVTASFSVTPRMAQVSYEAQEIWSRN